MLNRLACGAACSAAMALALAAGAAPVATFNYSNVESNPVGSAVSLAENVEATGQVLRVLVSGSLTEVNLVTWGEDCAIDVTSPDFQVISITPFPTTLGFTGTITCTDVSTSFDFPVASAQGFWTFDIYETFDDGADGLTDAVWDSLTIVLDDSEFQFPDPPACASGSIDNIQGTDLVAEGEPGDPLNSILTYTPTSSDLVGGVQITGQFVNTEYAEEVLLAITPPGAETLFILPSPVDGTVDYVNLEEADGIYAGFTVPVAANTGEWTVEVCDDFDDAGTDHTWTQLCVSLMPPVANTWFELSPAQGGGDAGDQIATAQPPTGEIGAIVGDFDADDADIYAIDICDPTTFVAEVNADGFSPDTQLFLFDANGMGVTFSDDNPLTGDLRSRMSGVNIPAAGTYYLAVTRWDRDPIDAAGEALWIDTPYDVERVPDGPGAANPFVGWTGTTAAYPFYEILMTGASAVGSCGGSSCPVCAADYDQNGGVDGADIGAFFADFEQGLPCADVDLNGGVDGADIGGFFVLFEAGGC